MDDRLVANKLAALATALGDRLVRVGSPLSTTAMAVILTLRHWEPLTTSALARLLQSRSRTPFGSWMVSSVPDSSREATSEAEKSSFR